MGAGYADEDVIAADYRGLSRLAKELSEALRSVDKIVTLAYYPDGKQEGLLRGTEAALMHAMSYDARGHHSPYSLAESTVDQAQRDRATLGLPFYGRDDRGNWYTYEDLVQDHELAPDQDQVEGISFNGVSMIERKVDLAITSGMAGVMIWEVGQDCRLEPVTHGFTTHEATCPFANASLLLAISRTLRHRGRSRATYWRRPPPEEL